MTDAEPALSPKAQVQVKFRPGIQVTALTSFPFTFYGLRLLPEDQRYFIPSIASYQGYDAGDDTGVSTAGSFL